MDMLSVVINRFTFGYMYKDDAVFYLSKFHYCTYQEASDALDEFLRLCVLDGDEVVLSNVISFSLNVVRFSDPDFFKV